jgi:hypothetical protein
MIQQVIYQDTQAFSEQGAERVSLVTHSLWGLLLDSNIPKYRKREVRPSPLILVCIPCTGLELALGQMVIALHRILDRTAQTRILTIPFFGQDKVITRQQDRISRSQLMLTPVCISRHFLNFPKEFDSKSNMA